jgi:hypothetical protein
MAGEQGRRVRAAGAGPWSGGFFRLSPREAEAVAASIRPAATIPRREIVTPVRATVLAPSAGVGGQIALAEPMVAQVHPGELPSRVAQVHPGELPSRVAQVHPGELPSRGGSGSSG